MPVDHFKLANEAEALTRQRIQLLGGFDDLLDFNVIHYYNDEITDLYEGNADWIGMYVHGSVDNDIITVLLALEKLNTLSSMADTIAHEIGHALWELLDDDAKAAWNENQSGHKWGAEEAFADDFMYLASGETYLMKNEALFRQIIGTT